MKPDARYARIETIPIRELQAQGVRVVFVDLDNTIVEPEREEPSAGVLEWLRTAKSAGMTIILLSNSMPGRLAKVASTLGVRGMVGMKPFPFAVRKALRETGAHPAEAVFIGDQILTDYLVALLAGIRMYLVKPLSPREFLVTRLISRPAEAMLKWLMRINP